MDDFNNSGKLIYRLHPPTLTTNQDNEVTTHFIKSAKKLNHLVNSCLKNYIAGQSF